MHFFLLLLLFIRYVPVLPHRHNRLRPLQEALRSRKRIDEVDHREIDYELHSAVETLVHSLGDVRRDVAVRSESLANPFFDR
jgi:hypothetical protein